MTSNRRGNWPMTAWRSSTTTATGSGPRRRWRRSPAWPRPSASPSGRFACSLRRHGSTPTRASPASFQADRFDHARNAALAALDGTDATACWDAGGELSLADAVAYARRGRGERQRPQFGWASLTPVERDVVRLVAEGDTNAEIGQRLFISVNTVKKYLSRVYAKVDVDGRADLAAQVARRGL